MLQFFLRIKTNIKLKCKMFRTNQVVWKVPVKRYCHCLFENLIFSKSFCLAPCQAMESSIFSIFYYQKEKILHMAILILKIHHILGGHWSRWEKNANCRITIHKIIERFKFIKFNCSHGNFRNWRINSTCSHRKNFYPFLVGKKWNVYNVKCRTRWNSSKHFYRR